MAGAVVVDVLPFLRLGCKSASAAAARHQPRECVLALRVARMVGGGKDVLHSGEEIARDERLVKSLMELSQPIELAVIDRVLEELMDLGFDQRSAAASSVRESHGCRLLRERLQQVFS